VWERLKGETSLPRTCRPEHWKGKELQNRETTREKKEKTTLKEGCDTGGKKGA